MTEKQPPRTSRTLRPVYFVAGWVLTAIGIAGVILPLLPGTVFLILAAACFARSSQRFENWLLTHPKLGPGVVAWRERGAIPLRAKIIAISAMSLSFALIVISHAPPVALWVSGLCLAGSALFVGTRPGLPKGE
jgi:uncharacterized membrane protein YbaN (DUF454 family)